MVFLQPSQTESAFIFSNEDDSDAIIIDMKGVYAVIDGGKEPLQFIDSLRSPTAAIVSSAAPTTLANAISLNKRDDSLVAVVGNLPAAPSLKEGPAAELYKVLSVPPIPVQLKGAKAEPIVLYKDISSGTLSIYALAGDAKDAEAVAKAYQSGSAESIDTVTANSSSIYLIVWQPARDDQPIKRILHFGSAPLSRIQQALERARSLPFVQSAHPTAASLKAKPAPSKPPAPTRGAPSAGTRAPPPSRAPSAPTASGPSARGAATGAAAARPAPRPAAPARGAPAPKPTAPRASLPTRPTAARPAATASTGARPARTSAAPAHGATRAGAAAAAPSRPARGAPAAKEEVAKKVTVGKVAGANLSHGLSSAGSSPKAAPAPTPAPIAAPAAPEQSTAPEAAEVAHEEPAPAAHDEAPATPLAHDVPTPATHDEPVPVAHEEAPASPTTHEEAPAALVAHEEPSPADGSSTIPPVTITTESLDDGPSTPAGLPVPPSPTIIPATPQPPHSPDHIVDEPVEEPHREPTPEPTPAHIEEPTIPEPKPVSAPEPVVEPTPMPTHTDSIDEPECVKELAPEPEPTPAVEPAEPEPAVVPAEPTPEPEPIREPEPSPVPEPTPEPVIPAEPVEPSAPPAPEGDLLGDFAEPFVPQQPDVDGLIDSLEEPMRKMKISMDTDQLEEALGLTGGDSAQNTTASTAESDMDTTQDVTVVERAHEFDDLLSPRETEIDIQRKLSQQAEESLLSAEAVPFIAGLASTVVEAATIDGAKNALESILNTKVDSPTGEKLMSFRSSGYENPDEPKEINYEKSDPAIDDVLCQLADESDKVNGVAPLVNDVNGHHDHVDLQSSGDDQHHHHNNGHVLNGGSGVGGVNGWPEGTTMHLPPPPVRGAGAAGANGKHANFKLAGAVHVDLVTVPHRGKTILLNDEAASLEFFSHVRASTYVLPSSGEVPTHVLDGWYKGKGAWAANVPSKIIPTHSNDTINRWAHEHAAELAEVGLTVATPVDSTTLTYPSGSVKACTIVL